MNPRRGACMWVQLFGSESRRGMLQCPNGPPRRTRKPSDVSAIGKLHTAWAIVTNAASGTEKAQYCLGYCPRDEVAADEMFERA